MSYYWTYYALTFFLAYAVRQPAVCAVVVGFFLVRRWLPDPVVLLRTLGRIGALESQARLNASNVVARRDLARAYLDLHRPRAALKYLDEARQRDARDPEIAYLRGLALLRVGDDAAALASLGQAVGIDPETGEPYATPREGGASFARYSEAYLAAAQALVQLGRLPEAEEALVMASSHNSSLVEPLVRLARVRSRQGDAEGARSARRDARRTFGELPGFLRRRQLGWGIRAYLG